MSQTPTAPINFQALSTPKAFPRDDHEGYAFSAQTEASSAPPSRPSPLWYLAHAVVGVSMAVAVFAPLGYNLPLYTTWFSTPFSTWWGVNPKVKGSGHNEMVPLTYFFLFMVVPLLVGVILSFWTRTKVQGNVSIPFLRRKPRVFLHLVSYGELLFLAIVLGGNVLVFYHQLFKRYKSTNTTNQTIKNVGTALGFTGLFNIAFLALPASRHSFWMEWLNIPFAHGIKYHNWLAVTAFTALVAHGAVFLVYYIRVDSLESILPCVDCDFGAKNTVSRWEYFFGILALALFVIIGLTSLPIVRRRFYNVFLWTHFLFVPFSLFIVFHWPTTLYFLYATIVLYLVNRMYSSASVRQPVTVQRAVAMPDNVVELTLQCSTGYTPGDAVWLKVPAVSSVEWHPFSVASTPLLTPGQLTVYVRSLGDWSTKFYNYVSWCHDKNVTPIVYMDGGYTSAAPGPSTHGAVVFVGGGIGITPLMGQLTHLLLAYTQQNVWLVWHVRQTSMLHQFQPWLQRIQSIAAATGNQLNLRLHVTQEPQAVVTNLDDPKVLAEKFESTHSNNKQEPQPYAHLSTTKRFVVLVLAFACSGGLLTAVKYGNAIESRNPKLWLLQRFVEYLVVILGSYVAYLVTYIGRNRDGLANSQDEAALVQETHKNTDFSAFAASYNVKFERAEWSKVFEQVQESVSGEKSSIGVYTCGPKTLLRAIDDATQSDGKFQVHQEQFTL